MIPITELRIHNLVSITEAARKELFDCNEVLFEENIHKVTGLDIDELRLFIDSMEVEFDYSQIEPIELTGEWLEGNGFKKLYDEDFEDYIYINKEGLRIQYYSFNNTDESGFFVIEFRFQMEIKIESVHQLQNLYFALTNKELTIK